MPARATAARRDEIVATAVALADRDGLDAISIRRLAPVVGTAPMNLYSYVASKEDLLERMAEHVVDEVLLHEPVPADWRRAVELIATRSRETFVRHPWLLAISERRRDLGRGGLRHAEQLLTAIAPLALAPHDAWRVLFVINDYTLGHAMRVARAPTAPRGRYPDFDGADYPLLTQALESPAPARDLETFLDGLRVVLDGVEHRYGSR